MKMFLKKSAALFVAVACLSIGQLSASADELWNNGPLSTGATSNSGVMAPAGTTWSEVQNDFGNLTESNTVSGFSVFLSATSNFRIADNFTVGAGSTWMIDSLSAFVYQTGNNGITTPFSGMNVQIWSGRPGDVGSSVIFGDDTTNVLTSSTFTNIYRIFNSAVPAPGSPPGTTRPIWDNVADLTGLVLTEGEYWIDYQLITTNGGSCV